MVKLIPHVTEARNGNLSNGKDMKRTEIKVENVPNKD